jgi:predicted O-methyltransferase YrrM
VSTLLAGYTARRLNHGHVWSLEHHIDYYNLSASWIRQHGLEEWVTLIHAPLTEYKIGEKIWKWYDISLIPENEAFEMILVDGPPGTTQEYARYPALPLIKDRINEHAIILVDDADRSDEHAVIENWLKEFPGLKPAQVLTKKGMVVLTF